jgi:hypothetical protein
MEGRGENLKKMRRKQENACKKTKAKIKNWASLLNWMVFTYRMVYLSML